MSSFIADIARALSTGFLVSIPIGPVGVLTMHRSATYGWKAGLIAILPVFTIDTIAAFYFLIDSPVHFLERYHIPHWFGVLGAIVLLIYGFVMYRNAALPPKHDHLAWQRNFLTSLAVAVTNPSAYLGYAAIAVLLSRYSVLPLTNRIGVAAAYCIGTLLWWGLLIAVAAVQQNHVKSKIVMQRVASVVMMGAAVVIVFPQHHMLQYIKLIAEHL